MTCKYAKDIYSFEGISVSRNSRQIPFLDISAWSPSYRVDEINSSSWPLVVRESLFDKVENLLLLQSLARSFAPQMLAGTAENEIWCSHLYSDYGNIFNVRVGYKF